MKHFMLFLIAVIAVLALVSSAAPAGATDAPPIETTSMSAEVGTGNVSQTITFGPQYSFYKFRVPNGGMYCQAKIRYTAQEATRVTTMKMSGTECYAMSISVDYGDGFEPWSTSYNPLRHTASVKSRAEVKQEFLAARDEVRAMTAEDSGASWRGRAPAPAPALMAAAPAR